MRIKKFQAGGLVSGILLPMGLICLFAFCTLALALMGGSAYRAIQDNVTDEYTNVIAANYLRTKLSQNNAENGIELREENGTPVLVVHNVEDYSYETRIYVHEGKLKESYVAGERTFSPEGGTTITAVASCEFTITESGSLFEALVVSEAGDETRVAMALLGGGTT